MNKLILVGVWRGNNMRPILLALEQLGYVTTTVRVYKGRLQIKNNTFREVITLGEQIWIPYAQESNDAEEEG